MSGYVGFFLTKKSSKLLLGGGTKYQMHPLCVARAEMNLTNLFAATSLPCPSSSKKNQVCLLKTRTKFCLSSTCCVPPLPPPSSSTTKHSPISTKVREALCPPQAVCASCKHPKKLNSAFGNFPLGMESTSIVNSRLLLFGSAPSFALLPALCLWW